jgi:hypothetical protein
MATNQVNGLQFVHTPELTLLPTFLLKKKPTFFARKGQKRNKANELTAMVS